MSHSLKMIKYITKHPGSRFKEIEPTDIHNNEKSRELKRLCDDGIIVKAVTQSCKIRYYETNSFEPGPGTFPTSIRMKNRDKNDLLGP